ncbi:MAG: hypothetical protein JO043_02695 [Candidatus Eremiobacteraeota bacterium]|nr:hypothetical protein [Candidatus Eremiobacteraeota bacterium]
MRVSPVVRPLTFTLAAAALLAGCSGQSATMPAASSPQMAAPAMIPMTDHGFVTDALAAGTLKVGIRLSGEQPKTDKRYGKVLGYFKGKTSKVSQVITLTANTNVQFFNVDSFAHTASFLGDATNKSAPWPSSFNGSATQSSAGTPIGTTNFSTGPLNGGKASLVYTTGSPGFYMFGCAFHYDSFGMRTVIIVK